MPKVTEFLTQAISLSSPITNYWLVKWWKGFARVCTVLLIRDSQLNLSNTGSTYLVMRFGIWTGRSMVSPIASTLGEYEEETNVRCNILLDASGSMAYQGAEAPHSKLGYATRPACLAYLCASTGG